MYQQMSDNWQAAFEGRRQGAAQWDSSCDSSYLNEMLDDVMGEHSSNAAWR